MAVPHLHTAGYGVVLIDWKEVRKGFYGPLSRRSVVTIVASLFDLFQCTFDVLKRYNIEVSHCVIAGISKLS